MPRPLLGKNLNLSCFSKINHPTSPGRSSLQEHNTNTPPLLRSSSSITTPPSILVKNFNSLYDFTFDCAANSKSFAHSTTATTSDDLSSESDVDADNVAATTPDFATVCASQRFFFSSPGRSNSIVDSSSMSSLASTSSSQADPPEPEGLVGGSIAIPTYSPDPFMDFRRSMQEMVEANELIDVRANWDHLHELLMCYLSLNPKSTHKFIVGAFADLLISLMTKSSSSADGGWLNRRSNSSGSGWL